MAKIKKAFEPLFSFLKANEGATIKSVYAQLESFAVAQRSSGSDSVIRDKKGVVVAILDAYFQRWMPLVGGSAVEFGAKENTKTGFNSMCKDAINLWSKQQREAKKVSLELLGKVASGEVKATDIASVQAKIETERNKVGVTDKGFATLPELQKYLASCKVEYVALAA